MPQPGSAVRGDRGRRHSASSAMPRYKTAQADPTSVVRLLNHPCRFSRSARGRPAADKELLVSALGQADQSAPVHASQEYSVKTRM